MFKVFSYPWFRLDPLNGFIAAAIILFSILIPLYSFRFMQGRKNLGQYYLYIFLTGIASLGAVLANNLVLLLACWGFLGLTLFLLINMGEHASLAAKKSLIIVGGSDALMLLGIGIIYYLAQTMQMDLIKIEANNGLAIFAYACLAIGCFAKAGAMPFHSWIPDCAQNAPLPVVAYLPASLDKLLGIYLLARLSLNLFIMNTAMNTLLMIIGAFTIIAAVMMALVQHNMKRLLGYHAISQVGYMVLGIGTGNPIGIAGGIFHMLNNTLYKSCLFLSAGNVEYRAKTSELDELGGLSKFMPLTYICCLIASLSISGIPPFNGFASKWLIYQGLINQSGAGGWGLRLVGIFCLVAAMFGSGLTLASFMKLLHAVFLSQREIPLKSKEIKEVPFSMWFPTAILAFICVVFGVFAFSLPLKYFIFPAVSTYQPVSRDILLGNWSPVLVTALICVGLVFGFLFFKLSRVNLRQDSNFTGGENTEFAAETNVTGTQFYNTIQEMGFLPRIYKMAGAGVFDIYEQAKKIFSLSRLLQHLHNGVLPTYLAWMLLGMVGIFIFFLK